MKKPLAAFPLIAYHSAPPGVHYAQSVGETCLVMEDELIVPGAKYERVPMGDVGAVHHEHESVIVIDAVTYHFALRCRSQNERDQLAFVIAYVAHCNLYTENGLADMKALERKYLD
ncbi:hypothetical protein [Streptomyces sp. NBC_01578]|uniref:hypothetical protein n=1 Tax=Streptomyces sp. NBC_01578 TaxID=2975884 RepID=UPI003862F506